MKRLICVLLLLTLLCGCSSAPAAETAPATQPAPTTQATQATTVATQGEQDIAHVFDSGTTASVCPLLYRVSDGQGNQLWLFGSIHVGREDFYPLPDYVGRAFAEAEGLAVECDVLAMLENPLALTDSVMGLIYTDGTTIRDHIDPALYDRAVEALEEAGLYLGVMDYMKPSMWYMLVEGSMTEDDSLKSDLGIDMQLLTLAKAENKPIYEVESASLQFEMLAEFSPALQVALLEAAVDSSQDREAALQATHDLADLWASGDEEAFYDYLSEDGGWADPALEQEFNQAMLTGRNQAMADYAEAALRDGNQLFICVGAAHVVGEGAMTELLAQRGYLVERVQ